MKKQLIALGLASLLTVPSVVLAESTWYGSFRAVVHSSDGHTTMQSNGSRWGVSGSSEVSEGLTAVYRYEENLDLASATLGAGNRLSYAGLSGGFGSITLGRVWSASYNHAGVVTDNGVWSGNSGHSNARIGSAVSYAASSGPVSFQIDLQMDNGGQVMDKSVDMIDFGMTIDTGVATVGLAHITKDTYSETMTTTETVEVNTGTGSPSAENHKHTTSTTTTSEEGDVKTTGAAIAMPVAGVNLALGWWEMKTSNGDTAKDTQTQFSMTGALGDTGMSYGVNFADKEDGSNPWNFHVARSLGGGASVALEHIDADSGLDGESETVVQLRVDF